MVSSELYAGGWQLLEWIGDEYPAHAVARGRASDKRGWAARPSLLQRASGTAPLRGGAACHGAASRRHILKAAVHSPAPRSGACRTPPRFEPQVWSVGAPRPTFARCRRYQGVLTGLGACRVLRSPVDRALMLSVRCFGLSAALILTERRFVSRQEPSG
jgi:hypothetical protein